MEEKKESKGSIIAIAVLACVTLLLSFVIWSLGRQVIKVSDENRRLQQQISEKVITNTTVAPTESVDETAPAEDTVAPLE